MAKKSEPQSPMPRMDPRTWKPDMDKVKLVLGMTKKKEQNG